MNSTILFLFPLNILEDILCIFLLTMVFLLLYLLSLLILQAIAIVW